MSDLPGRLDVVATPIGNLADAAPRMRDTLDAADLVLVEDTRRTGRLLQQFGLKKPLFALHDHNEGDVTDTLLARLLAGERMALVSDAGTPTISDPGFRLIRAARGAGVAVSPIPGPSAVIAALSASGLATDRFCFEGFLPNKFKARLERLTALLDERRTMVFFESVHRIEAMLVDAIATLGGDRPACVARELTKMHEQIVDGTLTDLRAAVATGAIPLKGEFVVIIGGAVAVAEAHNAQAKHMLRVLLAEGLAVKQAARIVATLTGEPRNELYQAALTIQNA
ncbi:MAG: 16S rRNA (cytidine(1402)-2'-O)-methyltransferase [Pseudomonadota bacterium]